jgi:hypothetical protein
MVSYCCRGLEDPCCPLRVTDVCTIRQHEDRPRHDEKNQMTVTDYYTKMSNFVDDLAAFSAPLHDDEIVVYLLASLDEEYNPVFTAIVAWTDPISPSELYA